MKKCKHNIRFKTKKDIAQVTYNFDGFITNVNPFYVSNRSRIGSRLSEKKRFLQKRSKQQDSRTTMTLHFFSRSE